MKEIQIPTINSDWIISNNGRIYPKDVMKNAVDNYIAKHGDKLKVSEKYFEEQSHYSISFKEENKNE